METPRFDNKVYPELIEVWEAPVVMADWITRAEAPDENPEKAAERIRWTMESFAKLTPDEWRLFDAYRARLPRAEIAEKFGVSESEVVARRDRMAAKFGEGGLTVMKIHYRRTPEVEKLRPSDSR